MIFAQKSMEFQTHFDTIVDKRGKNVQNFQRSAIDMKKVWNSNVLYAFLSKMVSWKNKHDENCLEFQCPLNCGRVWNSKNIYQKSTEFHWRLVGKRYGIPMSSMGGGFIIICNSPIRNKAWKWAAVSMRSNKGIEMWYLFEHGVHFADIHRRRKEKPVWWARPIQILHF